MTSGGVGRHGVRVRAARAALGALTIALLACDGPAARDAQPEPGELEPGTFQIVALPEAEVGAAGSRERYDEASGTLERLGLGLPAQIAQAWGLGLHELAVEVELPAGAFDVRARPAEPSRESAEALIRGGLVDHFGIEVARGDWSGPVLALYRLDGGLTPRRSDAPRDPESEKRARGEFRARGVPVSELTDFLAQTLQMPVIDRTGLEGRYDLTVEWDTSQRGRALRAALADAGFELIRERHRIQRWRVAPRS